MQSFSDLTGSFESRFTSSLPFPDQPTALYEPCSYLLHLGGKRVRPVLCLMACELFDAIGDDAWYAANAIELFHNFTLIHDDIMDKAPLRRGQPTLHHKYGMTAGILCGDVMCIYAYEQLAHVRKNLPQVIQLFNKTAIEVCEGQQMDMDFETRNDVSIEEYLTMITLKTSVLLACSLKIGALTGGALGDNARKLYDFGKNMGIAFQLQDDLLDAFGDTAKLGKQNGGDIRANKKTYLLLKAQENATGDQKAQIAQLLATDAGNQKVADMLALYTATGADKACRDAMTHYADLAFANLEDVAIPTVRKEPLRELARYLLVRDK
ncbi:polyprenyl synthetase family protein [Nemorincola caseinilytica]|uniref:Polyprenyl synthetase family protein n=1 Tax=Nemorincola caseinilytica TaxID=2054315 RepID=A0ABP8NRW8_9BACT